QPALGAKFFKFSECLSRGCDPMKDRKKKSRVLNNPRASIIDRPRPSECKSTFNVWLRNVGKEEPEGPDYCLEVTCTTHKPRCLWTAMSNNFAFIENVAKQFPLVSGGMWFTEDAFAPHPNCTIIPRIPHLAPK